MISSAKPPHSLFDRDPTAPLLTKTADRPGDLRLAADESRQENVIVQWLSGRKRTAPDGVLNFSLSANRFYELLQ